MRLISDPQEMELATAELCQTEPRFKPIVELYGIPSLRNSPPSLEGLLMIITEQFLSLQAAATIWARLKMRLQDCSADIILGSTQIELVALGLSNTKAKAFHAAARFDFDFLGLHEAEIHKKLCSIHGVGPWTADIYLLSVLSAADAWPSGDLALRIAIQDLLKLPSRPEIFEMPALAEDWRPWRAVAARLLWSHYRGLKGLQQAT